MPSPACLAFVKPNPGDPYSDLMYMCVSKDFEFGNTSQNWVGAFADLAKESGGDAAKLRTILKDRSHPIREQFRKQYGPMPAGTPLNSESVSGIVSILLLGSRVYYYLRSDRRHALESGIDEDYHYPVNLRNRQSVARCVCFFVDRAHEEGSWEKFFNALQTVGEHKGYFFASSRDEISAFLTQVRVAAGSDGFESFRVVGKPGYGPQDMARSGEDFDYVIRLDLQVTDEAFCVPSIIDAEAYEFFLPSGDLAPRRGRTVYVPYSASERIRDGIAEWVHAGVTLEQCLVDIRPVGPVAYIGDPPCPAVALQELLLARG